MRVAAVLVLAFFALYVHSMAPGLAAYRDTGEMVVSASTLGISHPPSYPLYILLGRVFENLPLAEPAYRLSLLSCAAGAAAVALLFLFASPYGMAPALAAAFALGLNRPFWSVTTVPEMYSLHVLLALMLLYLAEHSPRPEGERARVRGWRESVLLSFVAGVFLGNRTDLLLWSPGIALLLWQHDRRLFLERRSLLTLLGFFALGLSIYLYLPLRSSAAPSLDWNHPAAPANFWGTLTRRSYGATLDLLSRNYRTGELFPDNLLEYARHLRDTLGWSGLALSAWGLWTARRDRSWPAHLLLFLASGPLFLFLANLPPNPHALAIVEPHWLLPDLLVCLWLASGLGALWNRAPRPALAASGLLALELAFLGAAHHAAACRRSSFFLEDFTRNALRAAPPGALVVAKKDVQIFALWYAQDLRGRGSQATAVAQGLSGTPWYQEAMRRRVPGLEPSEFRDAAGWERFLEANRRPVFATPDAEIPEGIALRPRGLLAQAGSGGGDLSPWDFTVLRGDYRYERAQDFFAADLMDMAAVSRQRAASERLKAGDTKGAALQARLAWTTKWVFPDPPLLLGYLEFSAGALEPAQRLYAMSAHLYDRLLGMAEDYRALPDLKAGIRKASAEPYLNLGVVSERLKDREGAEAAYGEALRRDPGSSKAWYNLGSFYWGRDWRKSAEAFRRAAALDPSNAQAQAFYRQAAAKAAVP